MPIRITNVPTGTSINLVSPNDLAIIAEVSIIGLVTIALLSIINVLLISDLHRPLALVSDLLLRIQLQQYIFWFQIGVRQPHLLVHEEHSFEALSGDVLNLVQTKS